MRCFAKLSCHCKTLNAEATVETALRENTRENSDSCGARMTGQDFRVYSKIIATPGVTNREAVEFAVRHPVPETLLLSLPVTSLCLSFELQLTSNFLSRDDLLLLTE